MTHTHRHPKVLVRVAMIALAVGAIGVFAGVAAAHDTWLIADGGQVAIGQTVTLHLTSGELFPNDDFAIERSRVKRAIVRLGATDAPLAPARATSSALLFQWTPKTAGVAAFGVELVPKTLTLEPDKIEEYLTEIDATKATRDAWAALAGKRKWVESYSKHATSFVRVGASRDSSWRQPLGLALEIVPERDPTNIGAHDTLVVRVLQRGAPKGDFAVGAIHEGETKARFARTDRDGRARIVFGRSGRWLLNGTDLRRTTKPDAVWESDFVTTTLYVRR